MQISTQDWVNFIGQMRKLSDKAAEEMNKYLAKYGFTDTDALIDYAYALATKYGEGAAALAAAFVDIITEVSGKFYDPAVPAPTANIHEVAKAVVGTAKTGNPAIVAGAVGRLVKMAGVDTTLNNAIRDGAEVAWIPHGDTCAFCIALASRGWQHASKELLKNGHAEHIHGNCDCTYAIRYDSASNVQGYDPDRYLAMYDDANTDSAGKVTWHRDEDGKLKKYKQDTSTAKINAMRRKFYAENKAEINAQKRDAYEKRKEREASSATEFNVN